MDVADSAFGWFAFSCGGMDKPKMGHSGKVILPPASQPQRSDGGNALAGNPLLQKRFARDNLRRPVRIAA
jgi:hypothetical protein